MKIYKNALYREIMKDCITSEDYEKAAELRDLIATIGDDEFYTLDDEEGMSYLRDTISIEKEPSDLDELMNGADYDEEEDED